MLELKNINCFYGDVQVLRELSLTAEAGRVLCVLGRNGAGKTTMLKTIMGLLKPRSGGIFLDGIDLTQLPRARGARAGDCLCAAGQAALR